MTHRTGFSPRRKTSPTNSELMGMSVLLAGIVAVGIIIK